MQHRKNFIAREEIFDCGNCGKNVKPLGKSYRNHCPYCLYSLHVDSEVPGDRLSECNGLMKPLRLEKGSRKGYLGFDVVHECKVCGKTIKNLLAEDDNWSGLFLSKDSLKNTTPVTKPPTLILACSGGSDSVYLLHQLLEEGHCPVLAHFNHQLRGEESDEDEAFVKNLAKKHNLPYETTTLNVKQWAKSNKKSLEAAGRILRYEFLENIRNKRNTDWIVTAHHLNDNLETVLMHEMRGCKLRGQMGMQEYDKQHHLWRPLLSTPKTQILAHLNANSIPYRTDSSNTDTRFLRNHIRLNVIPALIFKNPKLLRDFSKKRDHAITRYNALKQWAIEWFKNRSQKFEINEFQKLDTAKRAFLLQHLYENTYGNTQNLKSKHIEEILILIKNNRTGKMKAFGPKLTIRTEYGMVMINPKKLFRAHSFSQKNLQTTTHKLHLNGDRIPRKIVKKRTWQPGDRFCPSGMTGTKKLQDFFTDNKIGHSKRQHIPILTTENNQIIAVGTRLDNHFLPTSTTKNVLTIQIIE